MHGYGDSSIGVPRRVCIKTVNPRSFYLLVNQLKEKNIPYYIPRDLNEKCRPHDLLIVDGDQLGKVNIDGKMAFSLPSNIDASLADIAVEQIKLLILGIEKQDSLIIGIDIGKKNYGVAVLINYLLVHTEITNREGLFMLIKKYLALNFKEKLIKIGMTPSNMNEALNLAEELNRKFKIKIGLVDEEKTNRIYIETKNGKLEKDENAAYNISVKDPIMLYSATY
jgi:RNase H-fold protein (predicted Holliday junction resolvase)